jgi:uncharacterized membrane protein YqaE (UPF0057 family)
MLLYSKIKKTNNMKKIVSHLFLLVVFTAILVPSFAFTLSSPANTSTTSGDSSATLSKEKFDEAMKEYKSLSKHEKKARISEAKKTLKKYKADKRAGKAEPSDNTVLLCILAILLPPLAVYLSQGEINTKFWISIILTLLFWIPGVIYAFIVIF